MTLPPAVGTCIVTGHWVDPVGSAATGSVSFALAQQLVDAADQVIIVSSPVTVQLANGAISIALPYTDNPGVNPSGFVYQVSELLPGGRVYLIELPRSLGPTVDISSLIPVTGTSGPVWANSPFAKLAGTNTFTGHNTFTVPPTVPTPLLPTDAANMAFVLANGGGGGGAVSSVNGHTGVVVLGAADVAAVPAATVTAKGDVLAASAPGVVARIGVGADNTVLTADSSQPTGLKWDVPGSAPVTSVNGKTGVVVLAAADVAALAAAADLSDLASVSTARTNLGLGTAAVASIGTGAGTVAAGNDTRIVGAVQASTVTAKGDVLAATAPDAVARLPVGADGSVLTADSTQTSGLKWDVPPSAPVTSVNAKTGVVVLSASDVGALAAASNLSDLASAPTARTNLGLGAAATMAVGTTAGTVAAGNDGRIVGAVQASTVTAKGDLLAATASAAVARLGVGADATVLTADSTQPSGLKWDVPGSAPVSSVNGHTGVVVLSASDVGALAAASNLSDVASAATARTNLAVLGTAANLSDVASVSTARTNLGLGGAAVLNVGAGAGTVAAGNDGRITGAVQAATATAKGDLLAATASAAIARLAVGADATVLTADSTQASGLKWDVPAAAPVTSVNTQTGAVVLSAGSVGALAAASNLSDLASAGTARTNLGLGGAAVLAVGTTTGTVAAGDDSRITGAVQASTVTAKGDLLAATASDAVARLGVGADATVLTADSTQASGLKWDVPAASLPPSGAAGGDLVGSSYPNPLVAATTNFMAQVAHVRLDQMATPAANVNFGNFKGVLVLPGTASTDIATVGQLPTALPPNGAAGGDLGSTFPNPQVVATHLAAPLPLAQGGTGSATQNFVDLSSNQSVSGNKAFQNSMFCAAHAFGLWAPVENNLVAATGDPRNVPSGATPVGGTIYLSSLYVCRAVSVTKIMWGINTVGATPTSGENWVALVDPSGNVLASVNVDARIAGTGVFTETIASQALTPGQYRVAFLFNAATLPQPYRHSGLTAPLINVGISTPANYLHATNGTAQTALPASFTLSSNVSSSFCYFGAIQ